MANVFHGHVNVQALHDGILSSWNFVALARGFGFGGRCARCSAAAVFSEKAKQRIHLLKLRRVDHRTTLASHRDKSRRPEPIKVESEGIGREIEGFCDCARWHAPRTSLHKLPEYVEAIILCERRQRGNSICLFHISIFIEIIVRVKDYFSID
jgi:hypothetical protein